MWISFLKTLNLEKLDSDHFSRKKLMSHIDSVCFDGNLDFVRIGSVCFDGDYN